jgi:hypothetical protein
MHAVSGDLLYRGDPQAYFAAYIELDERREWSQWELDLVNGVGYWLGQDKNEAIPHMVAAGYGAGQMERWREDKLAEHRLTTIWREGMEAEIAERFPESWDRETWARIVYAVTGFNSDLDDFCFDAERLDERLGFLSQTLADHIFEGGLTADIQPFWFTIFRHGAALALYVRWLELMDELNVPEHERSTDNLRARPVSDPLVTLDLPRSVGGCELSRADIVGGYDLRSKGSLGSGHWTRFRALGDTAEIVLITKEGWTGMRKENVPTQRHVEVLRQLGFREMIWPNGKHYEIRGWPGVRRIKD